MLAFLRLVGFTVLAGLVLSVIAVFFTFAGLTTSWMNEARVDYTITFDDGKVASGSLDSGVFVTHPSRREFCAEPFNGTLEFRRRNRAPFLSIQLDVPPSDDPRPLAFISNILLGPDDDAVVLSGTQSILGGDPISISRNWFNWRFSGTANQTLTAPDGTRALVSITFRGRAQAYTRTVGSPAFTLFCYRTHR